MGDERGFSPALQSIKDRIGIMIEFMHVSKCFNIDEDRPRSFQEKLVRVFQPAKREVAAEFWALRDVSFQIMQGETVGLIGSNGSGKSTVLKLISHIIYPTTGTVKAQGRIAALLELGAGFHPDLTGRENIELNGSILGLSRFYIRQQFEEIVAFSELERFIDVPIRNYSSGMTMRLGFSVATAFQPDVLLIDEVLAVGDQAFQDRCMRRIVEIQRRGATIFLVSHDLGSVQRLCRRAIWLDGGDLRADGRTEEVVSRYLTGLWQQEGSEQAAAADRTDSEANGAELGSQPAPDLGERPAMAARWGSGEVRIKRVEMFDLDGKPTTVVRSGSKLVIRMWYNASLKVDKPAFGISFYDDQGNRINGPNTIWGKFALPSVQGRGYVDYIVDALPLLNGRYDVTVAVYDEYVVHPYDHWHRMSTLTVIPGDLDRQDGMVHIPCHWEHVPSI